MKELTFDIVVLGGGHAGIESAWAASEFGLRIGVVTMPGVAIGSTPCNPSVGGVAKGQVVREVDALGGLMGKITDYTAIQFRTLNESKGYAVQSTRAQVDKDLYAQKAEELLSQRENLKIVRAKVSNVKTVSEDLFELIADDYKINCKKLIVTAGTFLGGKLHVGREQTQGGRVDSDPSASLESMFDSIKKLPKRFKTGTPPRLDINTIQFDKMEEQESDNSAVSFHWGHNEAFRGTKQVSMHITRTSEETLSIIRKNKEESPIFNGQIQGVGPRYCPSIEDKAFRYPDRHVHHVFVEPEGLTCNTVYPNGISTSLPKEVQLEFVRTVPGLEKAEILVHGYAVEYDVVDTSLLNQTLEYIEIPGLYFAGQVNGTSGYEEAAGQGIIAGINAARKLVGDDEFILNRDDSYIGVMIEDLISNTRDEPYRLFTARAENRLCIRDDNTFHRMGKYRKELGFNHSLDYFYDQFEREYELLFELVQNNKLEKSHEDYNRFKNLPLIEILQRPEIDPVEYLMFHVEQIGIRFNPRVIRNVAIDAKYDGYISRSRKSIDKISKQDHKKINWEQLMNSPNISFECKKRIEQVKPQTFSQLKRIDGIRPATLVFVANNIL